MAGPPDHRMGQGRHRRAEVHEGRRAGARHADLHAARLRPSGPSTRACGCDLATIPAEDPRDLRHDPQGRHAWHLPDREPGADVDAAAAEAAHLSTTWSSRWPSSGPARSRATWSIPICAAARARRRWSIPRRNWRQVLGKTLACRCFRNRRCASPSNARALPPARPTCCASRWRPSSSPAGCRPFRDKLIEGMVAQRL